VEAAAAAVATLGDDEEAVEEALASGAGPAEVVAAGAAAPVVEVRGEGAALILATLGDGRGRFDAGIAAIDAVWAPFCTMLLVDVGGPTGLGLGEAVVTVAAGRGDGAGVAPCIPGKGPLWTAVCWFGGCRGRTGVAPVVVGGGLLCVIGILTA
jgi:hypothetical protein